MSRNAPQMSQLDDFPRREPGPQPLSVDSPERRGWRIWARYLVQPSGLCTRVEELIGATLDEGRDCSD